LNWDLHVDMVCTDAGAAGLASAIAGVDLGGDVFVAASPSGDASVGATLGDQSDRLHPWLGAEVRDSETADYLAALSSDLESQRHEPSEAGLPISVVHDLPTEPTRTVAPFYGARLREWGARCLASPYGFVHTRLSDLWTKTLHTVDGETIEVTEIGSMTTDPDDIGGSLLQWLTVQAHDRGVEIEPDCTLQRIVFEDGEAIGAEFATSEGPLSVRARYGVTVATGPQTNAAPPHQPAPDGSDLRVCLVTRHASRFGRLELLTSESTSNQAPSSCRPASRQLHAKLRETHAESPVWRCAWGPGYPSIGQ
jgi:hypothetical protein